MALERILEPEVMDTVKDAQEYDNMDHSEVNQIFVQQLLSFAKTALGYDETDEDAEGSDDSSEDEDEFELGDVLDLGTGTALIPIELCKQHENCRVMAIDMAASMLDLAYYNIEAHSMTERINLGQVDAKKMGYEDQMFSASISNSIIHHLADPVSSLKEMLRVTAEGGVIFVRDLMRPDDLEALNELVKTYMGEESEYSQQLFRDSLHAALSLEEIREMVVSLGFKAESVQATSDRHWTWATLNEPKADSSNDSNSSN